MEPEQLLPSVKELVKDNVVRFSHYRQDNFYYNIEVPDEEGYTTTAEDNVPHFLYQFPVDVNDIGNATLLHTDKAIYFMRWIRKAREEKTLIKLD